MSDISIGQHIVVNTGGYTTFSMNGGTLEVQAGGEVVPGDSDTRGVAAVTMSGGFLNVDGGTIRGGAGVYSAGSAVKMSGGNVTVSGGLVIGGAATEDPAPGIFLHASLSITVSGGQVVGGSTQYQTGAPGLAGPYGDDNQLITVSGGQIIGGAGAPGALLKGGSINLAGGAFVGGAGDWIGGAGVDLTNVSLYIQSGSFDSGTGSGPTRPAAVVMKGGKGVVYGGAFAAAGGPSLAMSEKASLTIDGGQFYGAISLEGGSRLSIVGRVVCEGGRLTGTLIDGTPIDVPITVSADSYVQT